MEDIEPDLSHLRISEEKPGRLMVEARREKPKTRGQASSLQEAASIEQQPANSDAERKAPTIKAGLFKRALAVFSVMFHTQSSHDGQGEIDWKDFLHAMTAVGFAAEKLYGSVWHFSPTDIGVSRSIHVHEPHPTGKIPFYKVRKLGARLHRIYGWTGEMFCSE